jgi:hypothetical protein
MDQRGVRVGGRPDDDRLRGGDQLLRSRCDLDAELVPDLSGSLAIGIGDRHLNVRERHKRGCVNLAHPAHSDDTDPHPAPWLGPLSLALSLGTFQAWGPSTPDLAAPSE